MYLKHYICALACYFCFASVGIAQQLPTYTQNRENVGYLNPAALNSDYLLFQKNMSFGLSYRNQWTDIKNSPKTFSIHGEYFYHGGSGVGLLSGGSLINDETGPLSYTGAYGRFAGVLTEDPEFAGLSFGLHAGLVQYRLNNSLLTLREQGDILLSESQQKLFPDVGMGVFYYQTIEKGWFDEDMFYAGLSVPQVLGLDLGFKDENGKIQVKRIQHFFAQVGMYKYFYNKESFFEPTIWVKYTPGAPIDADFHLRYQMKNLFWVGAGGSLTGNGHFETGFLLGENMGISSQVKIGYAFDYLLTNYGSYPGGSHEINMSFSLEK